MSYGKAALRLQKELKSFGDSDPSIAISVREGNIKDLRIFMLGPDGTPHADAVLFFVVSIPDGYPLSAPKFSITTTGGGVVRLHPNLYAGGKVCVTALGTWTSSDRGANGWSPATQLSAVAVAIRSLCISDPFHGEPGFESCPAPKSAGGWHAGDSMATPAAIDAFLAGGDKKKGAACCGYAVKVRFGALRLGMLYSLLTVAAIRAGPKACEDLLRSCSLPGANGVKTCAQLLSQTIGEHAKALGKDGADRVAHADSVFISFADFIQAKLSLTRVLTAADECDAIHAALTRAGCPYGGDGSAIKKFYDFESTSNGAPCDVAFDALARDLRYVASAVCIKTPSVSVANPEVKRPAVQSPKRTRVEADAAAPTPPAKQDTDTSFQSCQSGEGTAAGADVIDVDADSE